MPTPDISSDARQLPRQMTPVTGQESAPQRYSPAVCNGCHPDVGVHFADWRAGAASADTAPAAGLDGQCGEQVGVLVQARGI